MVSTARTSSSCYVPLRCLNLAWKVDRGCLRLRLTGIRSSATASGGGQVDSSTGSTSGISSLFPLGTHLDVDSRRLRSRHQQQGERLCTRTTNDNITSFISRTASTPRRRLLHYSEVSSVLSPMLSPCRLTSISSIVCQRHFHFVPICEGLIDLGNISAVMRTAEGLGFGSMAVIDHRDIKNEKEQQRKERRRVRAGSGAGVVMKTHRNVGKGADKWMSISSFSSATACINYMRDRGYRILATHLESCCDSGIQQNRVQTLPVHEWDWTQPTAVIFGNEGMGVSEETLSQADGNVIVPMRGISTILLCWLR